MRYRLLGNSGLRVSEASLGTMTFGEQSQEDFQWLVREIVGEGGEARRRRAGTSLYSRSANQASWQSTASTRATTRTRWPWTWQRTGSSFRSWPVRAAAP